MPGEIKQAAIVNDQAVGILADHRRLHPVVEDFLRRSADRFERRHVIPPPYLRESAGGELRPGREM